MLLMSLHTVGQMGKNARPANLFMENMWGRRGCRIFFLKDISLSHLLLSTKCEMVNKERVSEL